jgi:hypothetical protein
MSSVKKFLPKQVEMDVMHEMAENPSMQSMRLSRQKKMMDMADGDEHYTNKDSTVGPINNMYLAIRELSCFPYGSGGRNALIHNTQINRR